MKKEQCRCSRCGNVFQTELAKNADLICEDCEPEKGLIQHCHSCYCKVKLKRPYRGDADSFKCEWCRIEGSSNKGARP